MRDFYQETKDILSAVSSNYLILPMGDTTFENAARTTVNTTGGGSGDGLIFTYAPGARTLWSIPTTYLNNHHHLPILAFNQSDEWLETPDAALWNDSAGASEPSYFWSFWVNTVIGTDNHSIFTKSPSVGTSGTDWALFVGSDETALARIIDDSAAAFIGSQSSALSDGWHYIAATKHDDAATSASVITYVDGVANRSDNGSGSYTQQEDGTTVVRIGADSDGSQANGLSLAGGVNGPVFIPVGTGTVPTAAQVLALYNIGRDAMVEHPSPVRRWLRQ